MKILVTGCGGDIGQSIGKILKESQANFLVGTDLNDDHPGRFIFDITKVIAPCSRTEQYLKELSDLVQDYELEFIIPTSEPEIKFFHKKGINAIDNCKVVMASGLSMDVGFDKLKTVQFLKNHSFPYPNTSIFKDTHDLKLPVILKSREGAGSSSVFKLADELDIPYFRRKYPEYIVQEFLGDEYDECTCGLFRYNDEIRTIVFKRKLHRDYTGYGMVIKNDSINQFLHDLAKAIDLQGSINVQLKLVKETPIVFEINPRFSSTVYFRHLLGYQDLIWSLNALKGLEMGDFEDVESGVEIFKGFQEFISRPETN